MSNSANMTMAERLAQKLKTSPMGELLDEDQLGEICARAINEAFFKERRETDSYGRETGRIEPEVVRMARDQFKAAMQPKVDEAVNELVTLPEFRQAIMETALALLPAMLLDGSRRGVFEAAMAGAQAAVNRVGEAVRDGSLGSGWLKPIGPSDVGVPA